MNGSSHTTYSYKLRSSGAVPIGPGSFLAQAFGGDKNEITSWEASTTIPKSDDFAGASIGAPYIQASFQRLPYLTENGSQIFQGTTVGITEFIDENDIPGGGW